MKVIFIQTKMQAHAMNLQYAMNLVGRQYSNIPLPLATLAALTPDDIDSEIIDENVEDINRDCDADIVAFTGILCQKDRLFELAAEFRKKGRFVVIGGPIAYDLRKECENAADVLVVGEAEYTWPRFLDDYKKGTVKKVYEQRELVDMNDSPIPRFDLLKTSRYVSGGIQATRGCPYKCDFCDVPIKWGNNPRSKPIPQVLIEIEKLVQLGFHSIFFVDDHFAGNVGYAKKLLRAIGELRLRLPYPVIFYAQVSINIALDDELLGLLKKANFLRLFIGVETSNKNQLSALNKKQNTELDIHSAIAKIHSYGIRVWAGILFGLDGDQESAFEEEVIFISDTGITPMLVGLIQAIPGTPLYNRIASEGRLIPLPFLLGSVAIGGDKGSFNTTNIIPRSYSKSELDRKFSEVLRRLFTPQSFGDRLLKAFGQERGPHYSGLAGITARNLKVTAKVAIFYLTSDGENRRLFYRAIYSYLMGRSKNFGEIMFHLGAYIHLRKFYNNLADTIESNTVPNDTHT